MKKTEYLQIRISKDLKAALEEKAAGCGLTTSAYITMIIVKNIKQKEN